jgi:DNA-binding response OmpR family regulator
MPARILVVEDEPAVRDVLIRALREAGYEVVGMDDGLAGWDAATTATAPYDLVVTNNCMPHMNGAELVAKLRARFPNLPILHIDDRSDRDPGHLPADVPNLTKPFRIETLLDRVQELI